ncbi:hypothetical protein WP50_38950, partial [Lactiplantibacillus plantarum]
TVLTNQQVAAVATPKPFPNPGTGLNVVVIDFGIRHGILRELSRRVFNGTVLPYTATTEEILNLDPDGGPMKASIVDVADAHAFDQLGATVLTNQQVAAVATPKPFPNPGTGLNVVVIDFGLKHGILRELSKRACNVTVLPYTATTEEILNLDPDGGPMKASIVDVADAHAFDQLGATVLTNQQVAAVATPKPFPNPGTGLNVVVIDFGLKHGILRELSKRAFNVTVLPYTATTEEILNLDPDGGPMKASIVDVADAHAFDQLGATVLTNQQVAAVATPKPFPNPGTGLNVVVIDFGLKHGILRELSKRACNVTVLHYTETTEAILNSDPDGGPMKASIVDVADAHAFDQL